MELLIERGGRKLDVRLGVLGVLALLELGCHERESFCALWVG